MSRKLSTKATKIVQKAIGATLKATEDEVTPLDSNDAPQDATPTPLRAVHVNPAKEGSVSPPTQKVSEAKPAIKRTLIIPTSGHAIKRLNNVDKECEIEKFNYTIEINVLQAKMKEADNKASARKVEILQGEMEANGISYITPIEKLSADYSEITVLDLSKPKADK